MAKIRRGGVTGFARGRAGNYVYAVMPGSATSSGSREQIVRQAPDGVTNPKTTSQCMQRMKLGPAQRFYNAFAELLSNAFQGVNYGNPSRRHFISEALKAEGPYLQKGVDRFIPAEYLFSDGSLPSVPYADRASMFNNGVLLTGLTGVPSFEAHVSPADLATALGVNVDTQITIVVVTNNNGIFEPHYIGFSERLTIAELPGASILSIGTDSKVGFKLDELNLPTTNLVASAIVLSKQDAGGKWLRSRQYMQVNDDLYNQCYSEAAFNAAVLSYSEAGSANALPSNWYYNLGLANQPFNGRIIVGQIPAGYYVTGAQGLTPWVQGAMGAPVTGLYTDGTRVLFGYMEGTTAYIICTDSVNGSEYYYTAVANWDTTRNKQLVAWTDAYAAQANLTKKPQVLTPLDFEFPITAENLEDCTMKLNYGTLDSEKLIAGFKMIDSNKDIYSVVLSGGSLKLFSENEVYNEVRIADNKQSISFGTSDSSVSFVGFTYNA